MMAGMALFENNDHFVRENEEIDHKEHSQRFPVYLARRPIVEAILIAYGIIVAITIVLLMLYSALAGHPHSSYYP